MQVVRGCLCKWRPKENNDGSLRAGSRRRWGLNDPNRGETVMHRRDIVAPSLKESTLGVHSNFNNILSSIFLLS